MMSIDQIEEPFKSKIIKILQNESNSDKLLQSLKLYMLNEDYFKRLNVDAAWIAYEIVKNYNKR
jgi:hypothetical protein